MSTANLLKGIRIEYHILQSFPVTCLNRDDVGAPKTAFVGGVPRARVSSQCWKRSMRLSLHEMGYRIGIRTKMLAELIALDCLELSASEDKAQLCGTLIANSLTVDTLFFISKAEVRRLAEYAAEKDFDLPFEKSKKGKGEDAGSNKLTKNALPKIRKCLSYAKTAADGLDIALFGRMVAQDASLNVNGAVSVAHALSTHKVSNELDFFTALDDFITMHHEGEEKLPGSSHMGTLEFNSATYYRYIALDLGQLWENLGGNEDILSSIEAFTKALYVAVPSARQTTQTGLCPWDYARILIRKGQGMQLCFDTPVRCSPGGGWLEPSIKALDEGLARQEHLAGSLYGKISEVTYGGKENSSIDVVLDTLKRTVTQLMEPEV